MITVLGIYYVWILNQNATNGYNIRNLQLQYHSLAFQENLLDIRIAEGKSIDSIMRSDVVSVMQAVDKPTFLVQTDTPATMNN